jgi:ribosomal protein S18 acetylase RimI-like enzyme
MIAKTQQMTIRSAQVVDRQLLASLIHFEPHVHRHLDWRPPLDWVGNDPYLVMELDGVLVSALACPPDPPETAWIRLFAVSTRISSQKAWEELWPVAREYLIDHYGPIRMAAIPLQSWFRTLLDKSDFKNTHNVVVLMWDENQLPPEKTGDLCTIRPMNYDDIATVHEIDVASFEPLWQNSLSGLETAFRQATLATVAEGPDGLIGYQISTSSPVGGHLARLAVYPEYQGKGVGYQLVHDLLKQFRRRGAQSVTVNTQFNNKTSLTLYKKAGFRLTGEEYPIYEYTKMD